MFHFVFHFQECYSLYHFGSEDYFQDGQFCLYLNTITFSYSLENKRLLHVIQCSKSWENTSLWPYYMCWATCPITTQMQFHSTNQVQVMYAVFCYRLCRVVVVAIQCYLQDGYGYSVPGSLILFHFIVLLRDWSNLRWSNTPHWVHSIQSILESISSNTYCK